MAKTRPPARITQDVEALWGLVTTAPPDLLFTYADLEEILAETPGQRLPRWRIYQAIARVNRRLLPTEKRYWHVVRNVGYRLLKAEEHLPVAQRKRASATAQIQQGLDLLAHVRQEELTATQRQAHAGMLMIMSGVYQAVKDAEFRIARQDAVLDELRQRVGRIEQKEPPHA